VIARTDAALGLGIDDAINRGRQYRAAGADMIFVELKRATEEELARITEEIDAPLLINVEEAGSISRFSVEEIDQLGFRLAIYPGLARYAAGFAIREALEVLKRDGNTIATRNRMLSFEQYNEVLQLGDIENWEQQFLPK
jgi:methylisocitrate lyase